VFSRSGLKCKDVGFHLRTFKQY